MLQSRTQEVTAADSIDREPEWVSWSNEKLLDLPMNQLGVTLDGAFLSGQIEQLYAELEARQLVFRPHFWLSNEWFTPDGVPGIAVPFYLAHPRLEKLEMDPMLEAEGGRPVRCGSRPIQPGPIATRAGRCSRNCSMWMG